MAAVPVAIQEKFSLLSYIHPPHLSTSNLETLLKSIIATKEQLCFHATLLRRHSQPFLFFLDNYPGAPHFKHWRLFKAYKPEHLKILREVFEAATEEVEKDEDIVTEYMRSGPVKTIIWRVFGVGGGKEAEEVVLRWSIGVKNRRLGRLVLDSWTRETNAAGQPEGSGSCDIKDVVHLMAAVWEEEVEKYLRNSRHQNQHHQHQSRYRRQQRRQHRYHQSQNPTPSPSPQSHKEEVIEEAVIANRAGSRAGSGDERQETVEVGAVEEFEPWRPFMGPPCLKRKDELHLVYRDV